MTLLMESRCTLPQHLSPPYIISHLLLSLSPQSNTSNCDPINISTSRLLYWQINLVCGGWNGPNWLNSCEINVAGTDNWTPMTSLPGKRSGLRGLTIDNRVLMIGNIKISSDFYCS